MMQYIVSVNNPDEHFIRLEGRLDFTDGEPVHLQLPAWRPGRYELGNFAKNLRRFAAKDDQGRILFTRKQSKDCWEIRPQSGSKQLIFSYEYYANQLDAGACYVDAGQWYINPVHCFMYSVGKINEPFEVKLELPVNYKIACQLPATKGIIKAKDFHQLADSPFFASERLKHISFPVGTCTVHFWFQGSRAFDTGRLQGHTTAYLLSQARIFGEMPCKDYHFMYQLLPYPFRHGVEHEDSTVIGMGQGPDETDEEFYNSLLAISSHELFHLWNVKRIRPAEMWPYDYTKENYSTQGYVYEGVTTYYGDLMLLRSGAWTWGQYADSFNSDFARHISNPGRFNYSVAESSWDTWLDGYVPGVPGRKTSIYIEGMLAALIADILIIKHSEGLKSLDDVMHDLYWECYKNGKGYTESDYRVLLEKHSGISFMAYFDEIIRGTGNFEKYLAETLSFISCYIFENKICRLPGAETNPLFNFWALRQQNTTTV